MNTRFSGNRSIERGPDRTLTRARIVLPDRIVTGTVFVKEGRIVEVAQEDRPAASAEDLAEDWLLPGLIDVHTDHLEQHAMPRPGVFWDTLAAVLSYDAAIAAAGITTVFDALVVGSCGKSDRRALLPRMLAGIDAARRHGLFTVDHRLHLRLDLLERDLQDLAGPWLARPDLIFITLLDDSPSRDPVRFRRLHAQRGIKADDLDQLVSDLDRPDLVEANRTFAIAQGRQRGIAVAGHDDTKAEHILAATTAGLTVAEFPISLEAAMAAKQAGLAVIAGAPNILNGRSHAGNVSVRDLIRSGAVTVLCSDYIPSALLPAVFRIASDPDFGLSLPQAVAMATTAPADLFGLRDRGRIAVGMRADLLRVRMIDGTPVIVEAWRAGPAGS